MLIGQALTAARAKITSQHGINCSSLGVLFHTACAVQPLGGSISPERFMFAKLGLEPNCCLTPVPPKSNQPVLSSSPMSGVRPHHMKHKKQY